MANSSPASRIRIIVVIFLACAIIGIGGAVAYVNKRLDGIRQKLQQQFREIPGARAAIGVIRYIPPHIIVIRETRFVDDEGRLLLRVPAAYIRLRLPALLARRPGAVSDIVCDSPVAYDPDFYGYLKAHGRRLLEYLLSLPQQDIRVVMRNAALNERGSLRSGKIFTTDVNLALAKGALSAEGRLYEESPAICQAASTGSSCIRRRLPYEYRLNGAFAGTSLLIDNLEISRENLYVKLWGSFGGRDLALKGFSFVDSTFEEREYLNTDGKKPVSLLALFAGLGDLKAAQSLNMEDVDLYILDVDASVTVRLPECVVNRLAFSINNVPVVLVGTARAGTPVSFELSAVSDMEHAPDKRLEHFKKVSVRASGALKPQELKADGALDIVYGKGEQERFPYERAAIEFKSLALSWKGFPALTASAERIGVVCSTGSNTYDIPLADVAMSARMNKKQASVEARGRYFDGRFEARGMLAFLKSSLTVDALIRISGVSAEKMSGLLVHFANVRGKVFSQMRFRNSPVRLLKGGMIIPGGQLHDFEFFTWLADFVGLDDLRSVAFSRARADFSVDEAGARLSRIDLTVPELSLTGDFMLGCKDMVASKLSLQLGRGLLSRSAKFSPVLKILPEGLSAAAFDFQLSGVLRAMNFQWLDSPLKTLVRKALPGFIERHIEQSVETMIDGAQH